MPNIQSNNKRIAKNTVYLYIRMFLSMLVSLYTSRVVLDTLGVEDYGVYSVVGGVVSLLTFLNASMAGATSRFLSFELGKTQDEKERASNGLAITFSSAMIVHLGVGIVIMIVAETLGLWFVSNKLVIPEGRMVAAQWVYQFTVVSMLLSVTQVPYNASIIAHEKMNIYAYVELLNVFLKLGIVFLLIVASFDKLIFYGFLSLCVNVLILLIYRVYCIRSFHECRFRFDWKKSLLKSLLSFSGWDLFGNMSYSIKMQGTSFVANFFYGVAMNGAIGIASTVQGAVQGFSSNILQAFRPVIIKDYAKGEIASLQDHVSSASKYALLLLMIVSAPLIVEMRYVMQLWLKEVPPYAVDFCQLLLINNLITTVTLCFIIPIHATGFVKKMSFWGGIIGQLTVVVIYLWLRISDAVPSIIYILTIFMNFANCIFVISEVKRLIPELNVLSMLNGSIAVILSGVIGFVVSETLTMILCESFVRLCVIVLVSTVSICVPAYFMVLNQKERYIILNKIKCLRR